MARGSCVDAGADVNRTLIVHSLTALRQILQLRKATQRLQMPSMQQEAQFPLLTRPRKPRLCFHLRGSRGATPDAVWAKVRVRVQVQVRASLVRWLPPTVRRSTATVKLVELTRGSE